MKLAVGVLLVAGLTVAGCSGSKAKTAPTTSAASTTAVRTFASQQTQDQKFLATLGASPYSKAFAAQTQEKLVATAHAWCTQLGGQGTGLVDTMGMTTNTAAVKSFAYLSVRTYCPTLVSGLPNLVG